MVLIAGAHAAGFGKITVLSSLGQPLRAEIELTSVAKEEESQLVAKLASADAYKQANLDFNPALLSLQFSIDQRGKRKFVRVTSTQPINEPFVAVLMELGGTKTRVVREFNVLLDPAGTPGNFPATVRMAQSSQIATPIRAESAPVVPPSATTGSGRGSTAFLAGARNDRPTPRYAEKKTDKVGRSDNLATQPSGATAATGSKGDVNHEVVKGETLYRIASANLPTGVSIDQMLVAMYLGNESAFINKNINRLRSGQVLTIPSAGAANGISRSKAKSMVLVMSRDFNGYRNALASKATEGAARDTSETKQSGGGKITAKVEEQANPVNDARDKLKLSRSGGIGGAGKGDAKSVAATEEQVAREKASIEVDARVKELEKNVSDLQKVLDVKTKNIDELQKQALATGKAQDAGRPTAATQAAATAPTPPSSTTSTPASATTSSATPAPAVVLAVPNGGSVIADPALPAVQPIDTVPVSGIAPKAPVIATAAATKSADGNMPAPTAAPGFFSGLLDNPLVLPGAGLLALLLAALGVTRYRKNKRAALLAGDGSPFSKSGLKTNALFTSTGAQSADTKNSVFDSNFAPLVSNLDTNVDPVAEADVYIAYGRDVQAEDILKEALRSQPVRLAIRVKLLEIYATRKDVSAFDMVASELFSLTSGAGDEWAQAIALGAVVNPANPLYASGHSPEPVVAQPLPESAPKQVMSVLDFNALHALTEPLKPQSSIHKDEDDGVPLLFAPLSAEELAHKPLAANSRPDLDFDLDEADGSIATSLPVAAIPTPAHAKSMMDALDFDLGDKPTVAADSGVAGGLQIAGEHAGLPKVPALAPPPTPMVAPAIPTASPLELELAGMTFDLGGTTETHIPAAQGTHRPLGASTVPNAEMATKLELAEAYQEIGDSEGARELLEEVLKGGDAEQVAAAKTLMAKIV
ncbi:FimV family protein [Glaciimonas immobilis]|uniref:Pilus assembly protein FimV n=2 Tax=Glaciimonas immobilis TaxID=728004 RepID=A0A840RWD6_9BURK|nr:FimV family protein [Glaciimonas immobilis]KAF3998287.1 FimV family protein [Glaciimonas immobilis]MBB5201903.1 pilus assembly protein FimV [Glaciimonas immobilis]